MSSVIEFDFSEQVTTVQNVKSSGPVTVYSLVFFNTTAAKAYIQMFREPADGVNLGTTVAPIKIPLPASSGITLSMSNGWFASPNGLSIAATTTRTGSVTAERVFKWP